MHQEKEPLSAAEAPRPVALLTGASEGLGRELAGLIARDGYDLIVVARNHQRLAELAGELAHEGNTTVAIRPCDLAQPDQQLALAEELRAQANLKLVINNAACSMVGPLPSLPGEKLQQIVSLNLAAVCTLSQAALQNHDFRQGGTLLNIGSIGGCCPLPLDATYSSTKAAVHAFTQAIAFEVKHNPDLNINVQLAKPGAIKTAWNDRSMGALKPGIVLDPFQERLKNDPATAAHTLWQQSKARAKPVLHDSRLTRVIDFIFSNFPALGSRWVYRSYSDETARRG